MAVSDRRQGNWLAVEIPAGTAVQSVAVYNRIDLTGHWAAQLGTFEVWLGEAAGDTSSSAIRCGTASYRHPTGFDSEPYVVSCEGASSGRFVTIKQTGPSRYLVVAEVKIFSP